MTTLVRRKQTKEVLTQFYYQSPKIVSQMAALGVQLRNHSTTTYLSLSIWMLNVILYYQREFLSADAQDILSNEGSVITNSITEAFFFESYDTKYRRNPQLMIDALEEALPITTEIEQKLRGTGVMLQMPLINLPHPSDSSQRALGPIIQGRTLNMNDLAKGWEHAAQICEPGVVRFNASIRAWLDRGGHALSLPMDVSRLMRPFFFRQFKRKGSDEVFQHLLELQGHTSMRQIASEAGIGWRKVQSGCAELEEHDLLHFNDKRELALTAWVIEAHKHTRG